MELADLLNKHPDDYVLSLGHFLDLTGAAMSLFRWPLIGTAVAFFFGSGLNWLLRRRGSIVAANIVLALSMCLFIECAHVALGVFAPVLGSKPLAMAINRQLQPSDQIISDGEYLEHFINQLLHRPPAPHLQRPHQRPLVRLPLPRRPPNLPR